MTAIEKLTHTVSATDGTDLVYDTIGAGPPIILIDGAYCSRAFGPTLKLAPLLAERFTVVTYDRRGRGDSGDTRPYRIDSEIDDLDTVINAAGGRAAVVGFSSGAILALLAAARSTRISRVFAYEPPLMRGDAARRLPPRSVIAQLQEDVDTGNLSRAAKRYFTTVMGAPAPFYYLTMRLRRDWQLIARGTPALPYDAAVFLQGNDHPSSWLKALDLPVHVISGANTFKPLQAAAAAAADDIRGASYDTLPGQSHDVDPAALAPLIAQLTPVD